jgi:hypothetical protein
MFIISQLLVNRNGDGNQAAAIGELFREAVAFLNATNNRSDSLLLDELQSVIRMVAVEVLEIRGSRAMRTIMAGRGEGNRQLT